MDIPLVTYRHLMLETVRKKNTPVFLGPVLIHYWKTLLSRELEGVRGFGTDGGEALSDAFKHEFGFTKRLTCFVHVRSNLKDKTNLLSATYLLIRYRRFWMTFLERGLALCLWRALLTPLMTVTSRTNLTLLHRPAAVAACQAQPTWKGSLAQMMPLFLHLGRTWLPEWS